jgi:hypothetical protein
MLAFTMDLTGNRIGNSVGRGRRFLQRRPLHHVHILVQLRYKLSSRLFTREKDMAIFSIFMAAPAHLSGLLRRLQTAGSASAVYAAVPSHLVTCWKMMLLFSSSWTLYSLPTLNCRRTHWLTVPTHRERTSVSWLWQLTVAAACHEPITDASLPARTSQRQCATATGDGGWPGNGPDTSATAYRMYARPAAVLWEDKRRDDSALMHLNQLLCGPRSITWQRSLVSHRHIATRWAGPISPHLLLVSSFFVSGFFLFFQIYFELFFQIVVLYFQTLVFSKVHAFSQKKLKYMLFLFILKCILRCQSIFIKRGNPNNWPL